jgi:hypothetical protein
MCDFSSATKEATRLRAASFVCGKAQLLQQQMMRSAMIMIQQQLSPNRLPKQLFIKDPPYKALRGG